MNLILIFFFTFILRIFEIVNGSVFSFMKQKGSLEIDQFLSNLLKLYKMHFKSSI